MDTNVCSAFQKALEVQNQLSHVQKNNEHLQHQLSFTRNQLTLTQQQLLGMQSMMTSSRLWVVSHDQLLEEKLVEEHCPGSYKNRNRNGKRNETKSPTL